MQEFQVIICIKKVNDGIVKKGVEATICNVGKLAKEGMKETNKEIIRIMIESQINYIFYSQKVFLNTTYYSD